MCLKKGVNGSISYAWTHFRLPNLTSDHSWPAKTSEIIQTFEFHPFWSAFKLHIRDLSVNVDIEKTLKVLNLGYKELFDINLASPHMISGFIWEIFRGSRSLGLENIIKPFLGQQTKKKDCTTFEQMC